MIVIVGSCRRRRFLSSITIMGIRWSLNFDWLVVNDDKYLDCDILSP
jgi:hypothetical protein